MPGVITDVREGKLDGVEGTFLEWRAEGFTSAGTSERMRDRTVMKFPTTILAVRIADIEKVDERSFLRSISKKTYKITTFIPAPSEEERVDIGLRFEKIIDIAKEQELLDEGLSYIR